MVTVIGSGEVQGTPDTLTINASVEFIAPDVAGAMNQTSERQQAVIDALVGMGIDRKDISTTQVSVQPQFAGGDSTAIIGYRASNSINIKIRQLDMTSQAFGADRQHRRRRHPDQQRQLRDRGRFAARPRSPRRRLQRRQGPRRTVRAAVRAGPGQGGVDLGVAGHHAADAVAAAARRWLPRRSSPASRLSGFA